MDKKLYDMIFKRKSFHLFRNIGNEHITDEEIKAIENQFSKLNPLAFYSILRKKKITYKT